jgi:parvulin-like peptidyl-prolyl isomerase
VARELRKRGGGAGKTGARTTLIAVAVVVVVGAVAGAAIYRERVAPFRTTVLVVDDTSISMRYFLKRASLSRAEPVAMLETLMREQLIRHASPEPPYSIDVSEQDVGQFLREIARGESATIAESEFTEWYRQQLNESRLSDAEFRDLAKTNLLARRLSEYLSERVATVAEQVHLHVIAVKDAAAVTIVVERLGRGEEFGAVARAMSSDAGSRDRGGDVGWKPRGALAPVLSQAAFDELEIGQASGPLYLDDQSLVVLMVSEKVPAREIDQESLRTIKATVLDDWLTKEQPRHRVEIHGFRNGYDAETDAWVRWQLERMRGRSQAGNDDTG